MVRKSPLSILVVDDHPRVLEGLRQAIPEYLKHINVEVSTFNPPENCSKEHLIREICSKDFDLTLLDNRFKDSPYDGVEIGEEVKARCPDCKVVLISEGQVTPSSILDGICRKTEILGEIGNYIAKPIDVGIIGYGRFGDALLFNLLKEKSVNKIYLSSNKLFGAHTGFTAEDFYNGIEQSMENSKVIASCSLEDVCENSDVIAYCSSNLNQRQIVYLMNSTRPFEKDRRIIFPHERNTISHFFKVYNQSENKPLILLFSNPPAYLIKMGTMMGISEQKITCTNQPDLGRMLGWVSRSVLEENPEFANALETLLTGVHGDPRLVYPPLYREFMLKHSSELDAALEKSVNIANQAARSRSRINRATEIPPESNVDFFQKFAGFIKSMGNFHFERKFKFEGGLYEGVAMYPSRVDYHNGISVFLDEEKINEIGSQEFDRTNAPYLAGQTAFYKRAMEGKPPGNFRESANQLEGYGFEFFPDKETVIAKLPRLRYKTKKKNI